MLILEGDWRDVTEKEFKAELADCSRVNYRIGRSTVLHFTSAEAADVALTKLQSAGLKDRAVECVKKLSDTPRYSPEVAAKNIYDTSRIDISRLPGRVNIDDLKTLFAGCEGVIYPYSMARTGVAIITFKSEVDAKIAFESARDLKLKGEDVTVLYSEYGRRGIPDFLPVDTTPVHVRHKMKQPREDEPTIQLPSEDAKEMEQRFLTQRNRHVFVRGRFIGDNMRKLMGFSPEMRRATRMKGGVVMQFDTPEIAASVREKLKDFEVEGIKVEALTLEEAEVNMWKFEVSGPVYERKLFVEGLPNGVRRGDLRKVLATAKEVFQPRFMQSMGKAIAVFEDTSVAQEAFRSSKDLKYEERPLCVTYMLVKKARGDDDANGEEAGEDGSDQPASKRHRPLLLRDGQQVEGENVIYF